MRCLLYTTVNVELLILVICDLDDFYSDSIATHISVIVGPSGQR